jgi:hypothetical protein
LFVVDRVQDGAGRAALSDDPVLAERVLAFFDQLAGHGAGVQAPVGALVLVARGGEHGAVAADQPAGAVAGTAFSEPAETAGFQIDADQIRIAVEQGAFARQSSGIGHQRRGEEADPAAIALRVAVAAVDRSQESRILEQRLELLVRHVQDHHLGEFVRAAVPHAEVVAIADGDGDEVLAGPVEIAHFHRADVHEREQCFVSIHFAHVQAALVAVGGDEGEAVAGGRQFEFFDGGQAAVGLDRWRRGAQRRRRKTEQ